jgi:hypothetical protein
VETRGSLHGTQAVIDLLSVAGLVVASLES